MSAKEVDRLHWMRLLAEGRTTQRQAAEALGLTARHLRRLYAAFQASGAPGLVSKRRGKRSNRAAPDAMRDQVVGIVRTMYADFGPTLACEKLAELHGLRTSVETVRKWMIAEGLWTTRKERRKRVQQPRYRRACLGELVQIDGCDHEWFEDRAPRCTALVYIDDATGRLMALHFARSESTFAYFEATHGYLRTHGKPVAFYSDKASIFRVNARDPKAGDGFTQFGRAMFDLNIETICANTPAAKGRVERAHQTLQDRLVKELRLRGVTTREAANLYAPEFMADYNRRFARQPANAHDAHRALLPSEKLERVFTWQEERRLTMNLTLHYKRVMYLVEPSEAAQSAAGRQVLVRETTDGVISIEHKGVALPARAFPKDGRVDQAAIVENKVLAAALMDVQRRQQESMTETLAKRKLTLRDEDLLRKSMGDAGLAARRPGRPTIREQALARQAAEQTRKAAASGSVIDHLVAQTVQRLAAMPVEAHRLATPTPAACATSRPHSTVNDSRGEPRASPDSRAFSCPLTTKAPSRRKKCSAPCSRTSSAVSRSAKAGARDEAPDAARGGPPAQADG
jgi:hypothetical protein